MNPIFISERSALSYGILALMLIFVLPATAVDKAPGKAQGGTVAGLESRDSNYWFQKGALCATYGNNQAAIRYFGKAIVLNPSHSGAHFSRGIAYGQMRNYIRAFADIDRAIEMEPQNGLYYYGRGRTHLLAGEKEKAMQDLHKAADLGDEDAKAYLKEVR